MKYFGKVTALFLVVCMILCMNACASPNVSNATQPASTTSAGNETTSASQPADATAIKEPYVASLLYEGGDGKLTGETAVGKIIKDKFNFELYPIEFAGSMDEKESLMLAAGDYPELMWIQGDTMVRKYINAGALVCLDDYLPQLPNFKKMYANEIPYWRLSSEDGKLYKWEINLPQTYESAIVSYALDIAVRTDALEKEGWPNLTTTSEYIAFFKKAMADIPESNGKPTIGIVCPFGEGWNLEADIFCNGPRYPGSIGGSVAWDQIDQKFVDFLTLDYVKQSYKFFNEAYREGILDPESFTDKSAEVQSKLDSGQALAVFYLYGMGTAANPKLIEAGHPEMQYILMPIQTDEQAADGGKRQMPVMSSFNWASSAITKNAKDPSRIIEVLEYMSTEEGQILGQCGVEGIHYSIENGIRVPNGEHIKKAQGDQEYSDEQGIGSFGILGRALTNASDGQPYDLTRDPNINDKYYATDRIKEAISKLGWKNSQSYWLDNCVSAPTGFSTAIILDPSTEFGKLEEKMLEYKNKYGLQTIMAESPEAFEQAWAIMIEGYKKLNPEKVVDKYNEMLATEKERMEKITEQYKDIDK